MAKSNLIRTILILIGAALIGSLFIVPFSQPATTDAALATAPPRATAPRRTTPTPRHRDHTESKDSDDDNGHLYAAIYGQVIDLSTGQPGRGLEVEINGSIVRTDSDGRYSLTGLNAGTYTAVLHLPDQATAGQGSSVVHLAEQQTVTLNLTYYSQTPPTPTPTQTPPPTPTLPPVEGPTDDTRADVSSAFSPLMPATEGKPSIWINPGHINNEKGVVGNIVIDVVSVSDFGAFQATLNFDPKILEIDDVILGNFLDSTGRQTNPLVTEIDNTSGEISFVAYTSGDAAGPNGGGTLAVVSFTSKQAGVSKLAMEDVLLVTRLGKKIDAQIGDGQINVTMCFGDLNGDQVIDIGDVQTVSGRVGQSVGDPNFVLEFDINNDGLIDEADVTMVTDRLYETCP